MTGQKPNPLVRLLPSLTDVAFLMPVIFLFWRMEGASRLLEGDTGWHIRTGEWIIRNGRVPDKDIFSFTKPGEPWFAWEWLWDVIFAWLHASWGMAAVVLVSLFVICLSFALLFRLCRRNSNNVFIAFGVTWLATAASSIHWWARPHVFSFLFAVIFYSILERVRGGKTRLLYFLPFITVLWANLHGGFFIGILFIFAYAGGELLEAAFEPLAANRPAALRRAGRYGLSALGCLLASFLNPYFHHLHIHIARYLTDEYHFRVISEFQSISFQNPAARYFEALIVLGLVSVVWHFYRRRFVYPLLLLGWLHLALTSGRNIPLYGIAAAPVITLAATEMLRACEFAQVAGWCKRLARGFSGAALDFSETDSVGRLHLMSIFASALITMVVLAPGGASLFTPDYDPKKYPTKATETLASDPDGNIFTTDEWGDYLIYRLYPARTVFIDGRSDFYGGAFGNRYLDMMNVKYDWQRNLERHSIDTVLLPVDASLAGTLKESRRWRSVYDDGVAIIFRRSGSTFERPVGTSSIVSNTGNFRDGTDAVQSRDQGVANTSHTGPRKEDTL